MNAASGAMFAHLTRILHGHVIAVVTTFNDFRGGGIGKGLNFSVVYRRFPVCLSLVIKCICTVRLVITERACAMAFLAVAELPTVDVEAGRGPMGTNEGGGGSASHRGVTRPCKRNA